MRGCDRGAQSLFVPMTELATAARLQGRRFRPHGPSIAAYLRCDVPLGLQIRVGMADHAMRWCWMN